MFYKLDCSHAYHCLQMAEPKSVELLAFNFASGTFAYRRLAQGLSRALSFFSSFTREYLDTVIKADQCAQYADDIEIAANTTEQLIKNIRAVFKCICKAKTDHRKKPLWSHPSGISWQKHYSRQNSPARSQNCQFIVQDQIS